MNIEIIRHGPGDKVSRRRYEFYVNIVRNTQITATLDRYAEETRKTKRHKWVAEREYARLSNERRNIINRQPLKDIILTPDIMGDVKMKIMERVVVIKDKEE